MCEMFLAQSDFYHCMETKGPSGLFRLDFELRQQRCLTGSVYGN